MRATMRSKSAGATASPNCKCRPTSCANLRPASSKRTTAPLASNATMRAPMSTAVRSTNSPFSHTAILVVPPPMSMFMTRAVSRTERAAAPEPNAASVVSKASPALTDTNLPACAANKSAMARELLLRTATPVRIKAPVSILSGAMPACSYCA